MIWAFIKANPFRALEYLLCGLGLAAVVLIIWHAATLASDNKALRVSLKTAQDQITEMKKTDALKDRLSASDAATVIHNERGRSAGIIEIERTKPNENGPLAPVLSNTYDRLLSTLPEAGN